MNKNIGFENELKRKMDEMASSVDCFDRIASRAFPDSSSDFEDAEDTITELEHYSHNPRSIRWTTVIAAAAALVLCLFFLAKPTGFVNNVLSNMGSGSSKQAYRTLLAEIKSETSANDYKYYDMTLSDFIENDILISPLYGCPFEKSSDPDVRVRYFVKMYNDVPTNKIYAVEYEGDYENGNFLAAAETGIDFTEDELRRAFDLITDRDYSALSGQVYDNIFLTNEADDPSAAYYTTDMICKFDTEVKALRTDVLYMHDEGSSDYSYDLRIFDHSDNTGSSADSENGFIDNSELISLRGHYQTVLYFNGRSARADSDAKENGSSFTHSDLIDLSANFNSVGHSEVRVALSDYIDSENSDATKKNTAELIGCELNISYYNRDNTNHIKVPAVGSFRVITETNAYGTVFINCFDKDGNVLRVETAIYNMSAIKE